MTTLDIQQAIATGESKRNTEAYSRYLKGKYALANYCSSSPIKCLTLFLWALGAWDNRAGAVNPYPETGIKTIIAKINDI